MIEGSLAPMVTVHPLPYITSEGVMTLVELRFNEGDDFEESGFRESRYLVNAATAKVLSAQLLLVGMGIEPEDDRP